MPASSRVARRALEYRLLADPTRLAIVDALQSGPKSVAELSRAGSVHPNTVRAHLARLRERGIIAETTALSEGRGRPAKVYSLREGILPTEPPFRVLVEALASVLGKTHGSRAKAMAEEEGYRVGTGLVAGDGPGAGRDAVSRVMAVLELFWFTPKLRRHGQRYEIDLRTCPYRDAAERHPEVICSFHLGLIRAVAGSSPAVPLTASLLPFVRPDLCRVELEPDA